MRWYLRSKIHKARVTEADIHYVGSISIDATLIEQAGLSVGEKVLVVSNTTGARLDTYVIEAEPDSGTVAMNGAAAHLIGVGEEIIVMGFELAESPLEPRIVLVNQENKFVRYL